jgi:hypothetical protein
LSPLIDAFDLLIPSPFALAKIDKLYKLPVITTASVPQGLNGPMIFEIHENTLHQHLSGLHAADREL